jgi:hypothetical protein
MTEDAMRILRIYADKQGQAMGIGLVEVPTMRDQFAMAALIGGLAGRKQGDRVEWAKVAYEFADAMIEARKEKK